MTGTSVHLSGYQARDFEVADYHMAPLAGTGLSFRGPIPEPLEAGRYFVCVGAAQTFGCFCERPYPAIVADALGMPALNLGYGGAGPEFFLSQEALLAVVNRARFAVLQVMSGRSQSNSHYVSGGLEYVTIRSDGRRIGAQAAFEELVRGPDALRKLPLPGRIGRKVANLAGRPRLRRLVREIREAWVAANLRLIARIEVPVILLWFSRRSPDYIERHGTVSQLFGGFPQLVNAAMVAQIRHFAAAYVECVTSRGSPQPLVSRFTGAPVSVDPARDRPDLAVPPWTVNAYYPSPEMHEDAAAALLERGVPAIPVAT